jgi:hypothetical protein
MVLWSRYQPCTHWVEKDVAERDQEMNVVLNDNVAETALEQVADVTVPPIRVPRETALKLPHKFRKVAVWRHANVVEMVVHLNAGKGADAMPLLLLDQNSQKSAAVAIILEDARLSVAAIHDVVGATADY